MSHTVVLRKAPSKSSQNTSPFHSAGMVNCFRYQSTWRGRYDLPEQPLGQARSEGALAIRPSCGRLTSAQSSSAYSGMDSSGVAPGSGSGGGSASQLAFVCRPARCLHPKSKLSTSRGGRGDGGSEGGDGGGDGGGGVGGGDRGGGGGGGGDRGEGGGESGGGGGLGEGGGGGEGVKGEGGGTRVSDGEGGGNEGDRDRGCGSDGNGGGCGEGVGGVGDCCGIRPASSAHAPHVRAHFDLTVERSQCIALEAQFPPASEHAPGECGPDGCSDGSGVGVGAVMSSGLVPARAACSSAVVAIASSASSTVPNTQSAEWQQRDRGVFDVCSDGNVARGVFDVCSDGNDAAVVTGKAHSDRPISGGLRSTSCAGRRGGAGSSSEMQSPSAASGSARNQPRSLPIAASRARNTSRASFCNGSNGDRSFAALARYQEPRAAGDQWWH